MYVCMCIYIYRYVLQQFSVVHIVFLKSMSFFLFVSIISLYSSMQMYKQFVVVIVTVLSYICLYIVIVALDKSTYIVAKNKVVQWCIIYNPPCIIHLHYYKSLVCQALFFCCFLFYFKHSQPLSLSLFYSYCVNLVL